MTDASSLEELFAKTMKNTGFEGFGLGTIMKIPCPFCGEPGFITAKVTAIEEALTSGGFCSGCGRGAKMVLGAIPGAPNSVRLADGKSFEIVQTTGPDSPEWMVPKIRRLPAQ